MQNQFHPLVSQWFSERFTSPTPPQKAGWQHISEGNDTLIAAPTGSGKTLAAFLWSIDRLIRRGAEGRLEDRTSVLYISPLKALGNDIQKNLQEPLAGVIQLAWAKGLGIPEIRVAVRSGDTPAPERQLMIRRPPHILITTPESFYILLTAARSRRILKTVETVIVDEIHAVAGDKRGAHLALSLERLDALAGHRLQRVGLSATQKPIDEIARLLVGDNRVRADGTPDCAIVNVGHKRDLELSIEVSDHELGPIASHELWAEVYERIAAQVRMHRATLVFVNTRRLVERVSHQLTMRLGEGKVAAHHGSLSRKTRLEAEQKLKAAEVPVVVATASLELGIDIGHVDLVCHIGAPRALATLLQRVGRSGHWQDAIPKGILYPLTRDDLLQCAAAIRDVRSGKLDRINLPERPMDILAQQMVATVASLTPPKRTQTRLPFTEEEAEASGIGEEDLWKLVRGAYPYRNLTREEFEKVLEMLSEGMARRKGRRSAYLHRDRIHGCLRARRGARLTAITNGGAIPDTADYDVIESPDETFVGRVNEDFAIESLAGDIFLLGNKSWRIRRVGSGKVWVEDAHGAPPTVPFWLGEAPARTAELSQAVSELRREVAERLRDVAGTIDWLVRESGVPEAGAEQIVGYIRETQAILGCVPTGKHIVAERFFDEAGGMQLVLHAPLGGRINRAWGLALRKRFCVTFDFELQAAATDDGIVLSLGERHSFPLESVFSYLHPSTLEEDLIQAALASPIFTSRWRWNATRALAVQRHSGGRKVPMAIQRIRAEELLTAVFPEQLMCQDNRSGPTDPPDHPLVNETMQNCLREAMDIDGLREILDRIRQGEISTLAVDTSTPSPMAHEILNANPFAFLDDAPLEERRARAVALRRTDPDLARGIGALSPEAIEEVRLQAWPDVRDADELHDLLLSLGLLPAEEARRWSGLAGELIAARRATGARWKPEKGAEERCGYVAAERLCLIQAAFPELRTDPEIHLPESPHGQGIPPTADEAIREIVQGWMEVVGPITSSTLARRTGLSVAQVKQALSALEASGGVLQGHFNPGGVGEAEIEWCERGLLARIHRLTVGRLRREI
ncbi:MAG: DNA glycosylase AlkZ-like family protein, partial [Anaerolineae bacterium]